MRIGRAAWAALIAAGSAALVGCSGSNTGTVSGTVLVDGRPADNGYVTFSPADGSGQPVTGRIESDGSYSARDVPVGNMKVAVRVSRGTGQTKADFPGPGGVKQELKEEALPEKYNDRTELTFEVRPGKNEKDWDLKGKQAEPKR